MMPRVTLSVEEWRAVAGELAARHTAQAPPGLVERIQALLAQAPSGWPGQVCALELDSSSAEAVQAVHTSLTGEQPEGGQEAASVAEAMQIIWNHQQHEDDNSDDSQRVTL
jgi:hypothetical protein